VAGDDALEPVAEGGVLSLQVGGKGGLALLGVDGLAEADSLHDCFAVQAVEELGRGVGQNLDLERLHGVSPLAARRRAATLLAVA
jgi:hypothetical protein